MPAAPPRQRIAVLGGGMAALSAVADLTRDSDWQDRYEITVYQLGWRVGGKGASGRNRKLADRIEEHGLHVWFGCYDQAFRLLRGCYEELDRPESVAIRSIDDAFEHQDATPYMQRFEGRWVEWPIYFPPNDQVPGVDEGEFAILDYIREISRWIEHQLSHPFAGSHEFSHAPHEIPEWLEKLVPQPASDLADRPQGALRHDTYGHKLSRLVHSLLPQPADHSAEQHRGIGWLADQLGNWFHGERQRLGHLKLDLERLAIGIDLATTLLRGFVADDVITGGFDVIDRWDTRDWLRRHGAREETLESAPIRALYDLCFAYEDGDLERPNFAAGPALHVVMRIAFQYRGHVVYEMTAGMGDVVIAPLYELLAKRGVRFEFFHRVEGLELSEDQRSVARVRVARQVDLLVDEYQPLFDVPYPKGKTLPCFPSTPLIEQIENGERLAGVNLESKWSGWTDAAHEVLEAGRDFDQVVLGISLAGVKELCPEFPAAQTEAGPRWAALFDEMKTVQTVGNELWMSRTLEGLGWAGGAVPVDAAPEPLDVWADRTKLLDAERWSGPRTPQSLQYQCGPLPGDFASRPASDLGVPSEAAAEARRVTVAWLRRYATVLWPKATGLDGFDWDALFDAGNAEGEARLDAQYLRANVDPSERYVLSVADSGHARMDAGDSGFDNLVLVGDWTRTAWNAGCIEACALAGENAARAVQARRAKGGP